MSRQVNLRRLLATAALAVGPALAPAQTNTAEAGRQLYMQNGCFSCHGTAGQGGERSAAPRLAPGPYPYEAFRALVRTPREAMPRFDVKYLSDDQLRAIHTYLVSINKGPAARDIPVLQGLLDR
jgi:mono/diheme cytochrome c family protein